MSANHGAKRANASSWPIWLLFAAWFCANSPQSVTYDLIQWTRDARHFTHQERLKADVAAMLSGKNGKMTAQVEKPPARPSAPPIPAEAVLKKIDLYAPIGITSVAPPVRNLILPTEFVRTPNRSRPEPLLPPPRWLVKSLTVLRGPLYARKSDPAMHRPSWAEAFFNAAGLPTRLALLFECVPEIIISFHVLFLFPQAAPRWRCRLLSRWGRPIRGVKRKRIPRQLVPAQTASLQRALRTAAPDSNPNPPPPLVISGADETSNPVDSDGGVGLSRVARMS